jgi:DsbC/DsbD-like thiol-disulfide interchange protein
MGVAAKVSPRFSPREERKFQAMQKSSTAAHTDRLMAIAFAVPLLLAGAHAAFAAESAWVKDSYSKARLVGGVSEQDGKTERLAGVQIRLAPGWKTYWRSPGDSGVPPTFDWSGSKNLKSAEVLFPAPHRFADAGGTAIGYSDEVVFPVRITPERADEPVELKLNLAYGVCKTLCVPSEESLTLELPAQGGGGTADQLLIQRYLDIVPKPVAKGELPAIGAVEEKLDGKRPEIVLEAIFPDGATGTDLFAEAPEDIFVPVPKPVGLPEAGKQRYAIGFGSAAEADALKGKTLRLTLVSDGGARETSYTVE